MSKFKAVVDRLNEAKADIEKLLDDAEDEAHLLRIQRMLEREVNQISLLTGVGDLNTSYEAKLQPFKSPGTARTFKADTAPEVQAIESLKEKVESAWAVFVKTPSKDILKQYEDIVIRGVAKKAKMKVTKEDPETITLEFINQIKSEIKALEKHALQN